MHDPQAVQGGDAVAKRAAHAADLAVAPLGQRYPELAGTGAPHQARPRHDIENGDAAGHIVEKRCVEGPIDGDLVFAFVAVLDAQNLVDDIAIVGQQDEPGRVLVQATDRKNSGGMVDLRDDVPGDVRLAGGRDADRLVVLHVDQRIAPRNDASVRRDDVLRVHLIAQTGDVSVDRDATRLDQPVGLPARADTVLRKELVDPNLHGRID